MTRAIESGRTQIPESEGHTEVLVRTGSGELVRTDTDKARLIESLLRAAADSGMPNIIPEAVEERVARLTLSRDDLRYVEEVERLTGQRICINPDRKPLLVRKADEALLQFERSQLSKEADERFDAITQPESSRPSWMPEFLTRPLRFISRILAPQGSDQVRSVFNR